MPTLRKCGGVPVMSLPSISSSPRWMLVEAGDQPQQRGLSRGQGPSKREELTRFDADVDVLQHFSGAVAQIDVAGFDGNFMEIHGCTSFIQTGAHRSQIFNHAMRSDRFPNATGHHDHARAAPAARPECSACEEIDAVTHWAPDFAPRSADGGRQLHRGGDEAGDKPPGCHPSSAVPSRGVWC